LQDCDEIVGDNIVFEVIATINEGDTDFSGMKGTFTDSRDIHIYKWVKIGNQIWMAENLAYKPSSGNYWAYDNNQKNVSKYGYLYDWETAKQVCPSGWYLPSDAEWNNLTYYLGGGNVAGGKLKSKAEWKNQSFRATNECGFSALPAGFLLNRFGNVLSFDNRGKFAYFWASIQTGNYNSSVIELNYNNNEVNRSSYNQFSYGFSVRCLKD